MLSELSAFPVAAAGALQNAVERTFPADVHFYHITFPKIIQGCVHGHTKEVAFLSLAR